MAEKDLVLKEKVEHSGLFAFPGLYSYVHSWLKDENYGINEDKYSEKVSGNKRDLLIEWKASKRLSDYFKIEIAVKYEISEMTEVEAEIDGEKKKMNKVMVQNLCLTYHQVIYKDLFKKCQDKDIVLHGYIIKIIFQIYEH